MIKHIPYWRLSSFYFFYFAVIGALIPYWGLYLNDLGFGAQQIGLLMAILMASKIVSPFLWGTIADYSARPLAVIRLTAVVTLLAFSLIFYADGFWFLAAVMLLFGLFWNGTLPQFEAMTMNHLGDDTHRYSQIRLWGSVGFIIAATLLGWALDFFSTTAIPVTALALFFFIAIISFFVPAAQVSKSEQQQSSSLLQLLKRPEILALFAICFLMQASHGPYYSFFSLYLEQHDYSRAVTGALWSLGVVAEIVVFLFMARLVQRYSLIGLLLAALVITTARWLLVAVFVDEPALLIIAQLGHAASFGLYHAVVIQLIHRAFTGKNQVRGQALYSSVSFGAGGALGSGVAGIIWEQSGAQWVYWFAAAMSFIAACICLCLLKGFKSQKENTFSF